MKPYISGIQQIGIGVSNVHNGFEWYNKTFGMDIPVFEEAAEAKLMLPYTGGQPQSRHAILALNLRGGGGFEIWQYTGRTPQPPALPIEMGDLGLYMAKIKSSDIQKTFSNVISQGGTILSEIEESMTGQKHFYMQDAFGNLFEVLTYDNWFSGGKSSSGGCMGAVIGVRDLEKSTLFYKTILGYDKVVAETELIDTTLKNIHGGNKRFKRIVLTHEHARKGPFSKLLGNSQIELVQALDYEPKKIFKDRFWGDLGFIHLCFDIQGMAEMKTLCSQFGYPFTVDSADSFDMGAAAGHFSYIEDPDGTLIEFVETHKIPIMKRLGWYLDLTKRAPDQSLPKWMLKALSFSRKRV